MLNKNASARDATRVVRRPHGRGLQDIVGRRLMQDSTPLPLTTAA